MLSTPAPFDSPHDDYLGPWNLHSCDPGHPVIANISTHAVEFVRTTYQSHAHDLDHIELWGTVDPDIEFNLCLCDEPEDRLIEVTLAWFDAESPFEQSWSFFVNGAEPC